MAIRTTAVFAMAMAFLFASGMGQRASAPPSELHVGVLTAGTQGGGNRPEPSAGWISSREELEHLFEAQNAQQLPAQDVNGALGLDFSAFRMLMVRMGQKPTAGYNLTLEPESCSISKDTAVISLVWNEPEPGMVAAQVMTHPFILLKISKGGYDKVQVVDQHGQIRFELPVDD